jgi:hypothetical protein
MIGAAPVRRWPQAQEAPELRMLRSEVAVSEVTCMTVVMSGKPGAGLV